MINVNDPIPGRMPLARPGVKRLEGSSPYASPEIRRVPKSSSWAWTACPARRPGTDE